MGNSKSQPCRRNRPMYLLYLINRTWRGKLDRDVDKEDRDLTIDRQSEFSSRCSGCKSCGYQQDSLAYDSESEMAPNAEEELVAVKPWGPQPEKERLRPPTYNAEDYANALRRWGRRPVVTSQDSHGTLPSTTSSSSGYASGCGEMTLRQFTSVSELLNKLRADLRLAFPSFVQEFASAPADGITLLLETLRGVQLILSSPPSGQGGPRMGTRRAALDELGCVECLAACGERCADAPRLLSKAQPGLLALAVCLTSSLNRSRVLALQLLTKVCQAPGGHLAVSEAVSTLRLRYGEGGRFRFLAGALLAPRAAVALRVAGISFLNAFIKSAPRPQARLYIQAEACEAGLEPRVLQTWLTEVDARSEDALTDLLHKEVNKWSHNCVDVEELQKRLARAEETCAVLGNKVALLQGQLDNYRMEKRNDYSTGERKSKSSSSKNADDITVIHRGVSSNAEDEGISSSERSSSPSDDGRANGPSESKIGSIDNDQETTIDDVIEELRIIVKDAEEEFEFEDSKIQTVRGQSESSKDKRDVCSKISIGKEIGIGKRSAVARVSVENPVTYFGGAEEESSADSAVTRKLSSSSSARIGNNTIDASVKIVIKSPDVEDAIVPAILYPQPPRRAPPCLSTIIATSEADFLDRQIVYNSQDDDDEGAEEDTLDDGSDSLLSASRLKYNEKNESVDLPAVQSNIEPRDIYVSNAIETTVSTNHRSIATLARKLEIPNEKREIKTIRNFDSTMNVKNLRDNEPKTKRHEVLHKQFETNARLIDPSTPSQRRCSKYQSEVEKRKSLRRSASQDVVDSVASSPRSSASRIESRIRKFETLNAFENSSLRSFNRHEERARPTNDRKSLGASGLRMQRSESFHHVFSHSQTADSRLTRGGSDSGLHYVTGYDLEPLVNRRHAGRDSTTLPANLLTKSLDRIDEAFDSMVDVQSKRCRTVRSVKVKHAKNSKPRGDEKPGARTKYLPANSNEKKSGGDKKNPNNDRVSGKSLRSDELYDDGRNRQWNFHNEVDGFRRVNDFSTNRNTMTINARNGPPRDNYVNDGITSKYSTNDSGVYLPSGRYDAFGLGKNRFNAGKYSGHPATCQDNDIGVRRNSAASLVAKRGKVTDILSGLY